MPQLLPEGRCGRCGRGGDAACDVVLGVGFVGDDVKLVTTHSDDNRSYHVSSKKIQDELGFVAKHTIHDAVIEKIVQSYYDSFPSTAIKQHFQRRKGIAG